MNCKRRRRSTHADNIKKGRASKRQVRNWLDMPADIMLRVFLKLRVVDILASVQNVCSSWRKLAKEPILFRALDFQGADKIFKKNKLIGFAKEAVDRSDGQLVKLATSDSPNWDRILLYVNYTNSLKYLRLSENTWMSGNELIEVLRGLDSVEELDISCHYLEPVFYEIGRTCQKLKSFRLYTCNMGLRFDKQVPAIVRNMPQVQRLTLVGLLLNNKDLQTILDGCPHLEHLDLQHCLCEEVHKDLLKRCARIKNVIPPGLSKNGV